MCVCVCYGSFRRQQALAIWASSCTAVTQRGTMMSCWIYRWVKLVVLAIGNLVAEKECDQAFTHADWTGHAEEVQERSPSIPPIRRQREDGIACSGQKWSHIKLQRGHLFDPMIGSHRWPRWSLRGTASVLQRVVVLCGSEWPPRKL